MLAEIHPRLPSLLERTAAWAGRRPLAIASVAATALGTVLIIVLAGRWSADVPLFDADLRPAQSSEVQGALTLWGERFRANAQGTQIVVAASRKSTLLLRLTLAGLPRRYMPTSADVLETPPNALTPPSVIDDRRRSGIEGDLVAGLRRISGVLDATVVLPPLTTDPLDDPSHDPLPTAAVQLVLEPGTTLSTESISGIKRFVASAYPELSPDRVTVVDASGAVLGASAPIDAATAKERRVQSAVQSALDAVLGTGCAVVRVSVRTAGTEQQTQTTRVIAGAPLASDVSRERGAEAGRSFDKERTVRRYAYDTISEHEKTGADAPTRISVAVFLDARRMQPSAKDAIASLVRAAAGADMRAGDEVVVESLAFAHPTGAASGLSAAAPPAVPTQAFIPAAVACVLALFGFASPARIPRTIADPPDPPANELPASPPQEAVDRASTTLRSLAGESPQTAAYIIASLDAAHRDDVLRLCSPERLRAIRTFLDRP